MPSQINFSHPPQLGSPLAFQNFGINNNNPYNYPTTLAGYHQNNLGTNYHHHNTKIPSKQQSFNNLFASLQSN